MLQEVGLVIALYIITRLVPGRWKVIYYPFALVTALVAMLVVADLGLRTIHGTTLQQHFESAEVTETIENVVPTIVEPEHDIGYEITRKEDGPFKFKILGVVINKESDLMRESVVFNDPSSPVQLTGFSNTINYFERGFEYTGLTSIEVKQPIVAVKFRTALFDVFGRHIRNLGQSEAKNFDEGFSSLTGEWKASDGEVQELLTSVTYVERVRLADGTQWIYNQDNLVMALAGLNLQQKIGE